MSNELHPESAARRMWAIKPDALAGFSTTDYARLISEQASLISSPVAALNESQRRETGAIALINIQGVITPHGSWLLRALGLGGGGLAGLREALHDAVNDEGIDAIVLNIDSPGGLVDLVPETAAEIREARRSKKIVAVANTCAASAAYYLAAQASEVVVTPSGEVGSIGVLVRHEDLSGRLEQMGVKLDLIFAGKHKTEGNPYEPLSDDARAAIQSQVDDYYGMFTSDVAAGRGTSVKAVIDNYGEGRTLLATKALEAGMVDRVETLEDTIARLGGSPKDEGGTEDEDEGPEEEDVEASTGKPAGEPVDPPPAEMSDEDRRRVADVLLG